MPEPAGAPAPHRGAAVVKFPSGSDVCLPRDGCLDVGVLDDVPPPLAGTDRTDQPVATPARRSAAFVTAASVGAGVVLGAVNLFAQLTLPYPWANLANSAAVWAVAAFAIGLLVRRGPGLCATAGAVLLVVGVLSYEVCAVLFLDNDLTVLASSATLLWAVGGVLAGCLFGFAGHLRATREPRAAVAGAALPVAVLLAEAVIQAGRDQNQGRDNVQAALIEVGFAVVLAALVGPGPRGKVLTLAVAVPMAAVGWGLFRLLYVVAG